MGINMEKLKKVIIILLIIILIVFICILIVKKKLLEDDYKIFEPDTTQDFINEMALVNSHGTFFAVEEMLNDYLLKVTSKDSEAIYSMLDNEYIKENNITKSNVIHQIPNNIQSFNNMRIRKMYEQTNLKNGVYYVHCILQKEDSSEDIYFALYSDTENITYSIAHITKETFEKETKHMVGELKEKTIKKNQYNTLINYIPDEEEIANRYFTDFIENAVYDVEHAYDLLDEKYKEKRFPTLKDFEEYIQNKNSLYTAAVTKKTSNDFDNMEDYILYITNKQKLQLQSYQIRNQDEYTRYICIDNYKNYYVFYVTSPLNYKVMLDTYTIDMPEAITNYDKGTTEEKVGYNIEKIVNALNAEDYKYVYSKLADEFKSNYFKTYEDFEKYAKQTFSIKNEVTYSKYTESNNLSTYEIILKGKDKTVTKTIVMRLEEESDFVMSFNV